MKNTGIVRRIDALGRVVIPMEIRRTHNINTDDEVEIFINGDLIILSKYKSACIFCRVTDNVFLFEGQIICKACAKKLNDLMT